MHVCMYACMHVCMYACMHVCMYACMHVCMYACMHVCMYVCPGCMYVCPGCMYACMHASCMYACIHLYSTVPAARIRNKQKWSSVDTEMLLIWDCPGRSVLGLGRSGTVRSASGMVRDHPCRHRVGSGMVRGRSGTVRSAAVVVLGHPCWVRVHP